MRMHQPMGRTRAEKVEDWTWKTTRRRLGVLWGLTKPYRGRIAARGTHGELIAQSAIYREIVEHGLLERQVVDEVLEAAGEAA
jgi:hypothetical protein